MLLRQIGLRNGDWATALPEELGAWQMALEDDRRNPVGWRQNCTDPNFELQDELKRLIPPPPGSTVRILDVGSGPLTYLGKRWPEREVQIVAVDPLAEEYKALLAKHSIQPLVTPLAVHGENLLDAFQPNSFDLAYARNSLDHSYDPIKVICNMLCLVKPLHYVCLWHVVNEGIRQSYNGLHQWNFNIRRGDFIIGNGRRTRSVTAELAGKAEVSCEFQPTSECNWVVAKLRKLPVS